MMFFYQFIEIYLNLGLDIVANMACLLSNARFKYVANLVCKPFNNTLTSASQYFRLFMLVIFDLIPNNVAIIFP